MTLEEMKERLGKVVAELEGFSTKDLNTEDVELINTFKAEYEELKGKIQAKEAVLNITQNVAPSASAGRQAATTPTKRVEVTNRHDKTMGFKDMGEFSMAVANKARGKVDQRFQNEAAYEKFSEDGGVLVPEEFMSKIQTAIQGDDSLLPLTSQMTVSGNSMTIPVDHEEPWNGGIKGYWIAEGAPYTESKGKLDSASWRLHKVGAFVKATDELLEDAAAMESYINAKAPNAILHKINDAIIGGDGVGKPLGLLNSGFKYKVDKEVGQAVDSIVYQNIFEMTSRALPYGNYMWLANPGCKKQLKSLKDDNGNLIYLNGAQFPNMAAKGFETLDGLPIRYMMGGCKALGDEGDLILVDMNYYQTLVKVQGMKRAMSTHLMFDQDITAFKFVFRIDGSCPFKNPVTTQYGDYDMSGIITLADR